MISIKHITLLLLLVGFFFSVSDVEAQRRDKRRNKKVDHPSATFKGVSKAVQAEAESLFIDGMGKFMLEDFAEALESFKECDKITGNEPAVKYQMAQCFYMLKDFEKSLPYATRAMELGKDNKYYYQLVGELYKEMEQFGRALEINKSLLENTGDDEDTYMEIAALHLMMNNPEEAIKTYDKMQEVYGVDEMVVRQKQRIYIRLNKLDDAIDEGQLLIDSFPDVDEFKYSQVRLLIGNSLNDKAKEMLDPLLEENPEDGQAHFLKANILMAQGDEEGYRRELKVAFGSEDMSVDEKLNILGNYLQYIHNEKQMEEGFELAQIAARTHPDHPQMNVVMGDFLIRQRKLKDSRAYYEKAVELDGNNYNTWQQLMNIDWELNDMDQLAKHSEMALEMFPNQVNFYLFNGTALYMQKEFMEAEAILEQGLSLAIDPATKSQFQAQLADVYHELEKYRKSDEAFDAVLAFDPNDPHALNNYSYFLSTRKEHLEKAQEMASKLIEMHPDDATYLDTYGWVLYVKGDYGEAEKILKKAVAQSNDATVIEHYGDVLFRLGRKEEAIQQWQKAKGAEGEHSEMLEKKLAEGKLIE
ncbi:tetratricopeptide repeat protein [Limibacter armeniacum]|uniref:tetratricopeptide repeat protein n=1 Tax=Limibacter armeniacum TaxID=466084 RepID=UPI002FE5A390